MLWLPCVRLVVGSGLCCLTRRSRGIHAAWHFWYAVSFSGESGLRKVGLGGIHPLTQR
ncbi:TPA: DUF3265 domain-containing protein [Vibrio vulnificus]|nr:DUF3265 domain-containing protein [Vibrio vulnificus]HAS6368821.1 DUF3265 domain-containing protein [Vibrio vulnificus]HDY7612735.1 DUF3265 domain-containing protein [Vibrio vulnificus]